MIRQITILCIPLILVLCRPKPIPPGRLAEQLNTVQEISLTEQGGFTGGTLTYRFTFGGHIIRTESSTVSSDTLDSLTSEEMNALFLKLEEMKFFETEYHQTGNITYTLEGKKGSFSHTVTWPAGDDKAPDTLPDIRRLLMETINKHSQ